MQARALRKSYHAGKQEIPVLHGIDLDVPRGEFVSIMGPSGSGKSTLMNLLGLLDAPSDGAIRLLGHDVSRLNRNQRAIARRDHIGFIFQAFHLLPRQDALHNVMLPLALAQMPRRQRRQRAMQVLDAVGLADRAKHLPNELSGGQKQRVAIARALALDPPILMADEPTGNLDSKTSAQVMDVFRRLHREGRTIVQVTHDEAMARHGDRIIRLADGVIAAQQRRRA